MTLVLLVIAWTTGIAFATWAQDRGQPVALVWAAALAGVGLVVTLVPWRDPRFRRAGACILFAGLGMVRFTLPATLNPVTPSTLAYYNDKGFAEIVGVVSDSPDVRDNKVNLRVEARSIKFRDEDEPIPVSGVALVSANRFGGYKYGDELRINGILGTPPTFDTFSYKDYLARGGILTYIQYSKIAILRQGQASPIFAAMFDIKDRTHDMIMRLLPSPSSAFLSGILIGNANDLPDDVRNAFTVTGTSHLIAISGSNITIIAGLLYAIFGRLRRKSLSAVLMIIGLIVYTIFVGASASVVRAAVMGGLAIVAQRVGRRNDGLTALAFSFFGYTLLNPFAILDMGLVLSTAATLGLILYSGPLTRLVEPGIARLFSAETARQIIGILGDAVFITLAAQITTLPIIFLVFGQFSAVSFLVNILVIPAQASIMALGILSVVAGAIFYPLGQLVAWLVNLPLSYTLGVIRAAAGLPGAGSTISLDPAVVILYYGSLFAVTAVLSQPPDGRAKVIGRLKSVATTSTVSLLGAGVAVLLWAIVVSRPDGMLHVWYLAVGAGNAILIQTPNGAHILVDGGENATRLRTALGDRLPFYKSTIDLLIVTQPQPTTIMGLPPLFDRYSVRQVITNGQTTDSDVYRALADTLIKHGTPIQPVRAGYSIRADDGVTLEVISPAAVPDDKAKPGDAPLILRLRYGNSSFLLTSDLTEKGVKALLESGIPLESTVVLLPSNGDDKINSDAWFDAFPVRPQVIVIEAEQGNTAAEPKPKFTEHLVNDILPSRKCGDLPCIYRTDLQGTVEIATDGQRLLVTTAH